MRASHVMAFEYVIELFHGLLKLTDSAWVADRHANKSCYIFAEKARINRGVIAGDDAAVFEFFDALNGRGC